MQSLHSCFPRAATVAKADVVCLIESQDPRSTRSSEIEQYSNRDATVKSICEESNSQETVAISGVPSGYARYSVNTLGYQIKYFFEKAYSLEA